MTSLPSDFVDFRRALIASHGARAMDALVSVGTCSGCATVSMLALGSNAVCGFPSVAEFLQRVELLSQSMREQSKVPCSGCGRSCDAIAVRYHAFQSARGQDLVAVVVPNEAVALGWWDPETSTSHPAVGLSPEEERGFLHDGAFRAVHAAFEMNDVDGALDRVERLVAHAPSDPALIFFVAPVLARGFAKLAGEISTGHVQQHPSDPEGHYWQGEVLFRSMVHGLAPRSRAPDALASFDRALALKPTDARAQLSRCVLLKATGDLEGASAGYERLLSAEPEHTEALYNLGAILLDRDPARALTLFEKGERLKPDDADFHLGCARALIKVDQKMEARWAFDRARRLNPKHRLLAEVEAAL